jgi:hypothetical protein
MISVKRSEKSNRVTLFITRLHGPITPSNQVYGGADLKLTDPIVDSIILRLKWTKENVIRLLDLLEKTNCRSISTTPRQEFYNLFYSESGWGVFEYHIFKEPLTHEQKQVSGDPVSNTDLGSRTVVRYLAPL